MLMLQVETFQNESQWINGRANYCTYLPLTRRQLRWRHEVRNVGKYVDYQKPTLQMKFSVKCMMIDANSGDEIKANDNAIPEDVDSEAPLIEVQSKAYDKWHFITCLTITEKRI